jgi:hypothetical protein
MRTYWLQTIGMQRISVFKSALRTNNNCSCCLSSVHSTVNCESWNAKFQGQMGSHPAFNKFITTLNGNRKDCDADADKRILKNTRKLENGECSPLQFVEGIAHLQIQRSLCLPSNNLTMIQNRTTALMMKNRSKISRMPKMYRMMRGKVSVQCVFQNRWKWSSYADTLSLLHVLKPSSRERHQHAPLAEHPLQMSSRFIILNLNRPE